MSKPLVIYHGNCADGFTAAWLANMAYAEAHPRIDGTVPRDWVVDHHAAAYGSQPPDVRDRVVYILDFSYPVEVMTRMATHATSMVVIDHHESVIRKIMEAKWITPRNVTLILDTSRSGAYLTAEYFWPDRKPDKMIRMVDDRDRWQFQIPDSRAFNAGLFSHLYTIEEWNKIHADVPQTIRDGLAIERKHHKDIDELLSQMTRWMMYAHHPVMVANLPYIHASDAGHKMLEKHPGADFAATYYVKSSGELVFSLRSRPDGTNVAKIAEAFGGGGHANAAGFTSKVFPFSDPARTEWTD